MLWSKPSTSPDSYDGALVFYPSSAIASNVMCMDYSSLYPNIIYHANISSESVMVTCNVKCEPKIVDWNGDPLFPVIFIYFCCLRLMARF